MADVLSALQAQYEAGLGEGRLRFQVCAGCGHAWLPARERCPACLKADWRWRTACGEATIVSWVIYHTAYDPAWAARVPYNVALVQLAEGPRLITNVLADNEALRAGAAVRLRVEREGEVPVARFALDG